MCRLSRSPCRPSKYSCAPTCTLVDGKREQRGRRRRSEALQVDDADREPVYSVVGLLQDVVEAVQQHGGQQQERDAREPGDADAWLERGALPVPTLDAAGHVCGHARS